MAAWSRAVIFCISVSAMSWIRMARYKEVPESFSISELTLPILEAVMAKNTGRGIDFSIGNGFDQKTSEYMLIRYMNSTFFANEDGSVTEDRHRIAYDHIYSYQSDIELPVI